MNPRLKALEDAYNGRLDQEAIRLARGLLNDPEPEVRREAKQLLASCFFDAKDYKASSLLWRELTQDSDEPGVWLSAVTTSLMAKEFDKAEELFPLALEKISAASVKAEADCAGGVGMITGAMLLHYSANAAIDAGSPERTLPKIDQLAKLYADLSITDDHFLIIRGIKPLGDFLLLIKRAYPKTKTSDQWPKIFARLESHLDSDGNAALLTLRKDLHA